jgi:hypothetical protein
MMNVRSFVPSLRDSAVLSRYPGTHVPGYEVPPLRGWFFFPPRPTANAVG